MNLISHSFYQSEVLSRLLRLEPLFIEHLNFSLEDHCILFVSALVSRYGH